jgi:hypothetical protein
LTSDLRLLLATALALASAGVSTAQAPTAIKEVAKLVETERPDIHRFVRQRSEDRRRKNRSH